MNDKAREELELVGIALAAARDLPSKLTIPPKLAATYGDAIRYKMERDYTRAVYKFRSLLLGWQIKLDHD